MQREMARGVRIVGTQDPIDSELDRVLRLTETSKESGQRDPGFFDPLPGARRGGEDVTAENFRDRLIALRNADPEAFSRLGRIGSRSAAREERRDERQGRRERRQEDRQLVREAPRGERRELRQGLRKGRGEEGAQMVDDLRVAFEQQAEGGARQRMGERQVEAVEEQAARTDPAPTEVEGGAKPPPRKTGGAGKREDESAPAVTTGPTLEQARGPGVTTGPSLDDASSEAQRMQSELRGRQDTDADTDTDEGAKPPNEFVSGLQKEVLEESPFPASFTAAGAEAFNRVASGDVAKDRVKAARAAAARITGPQVAPRPDPEEEGEEAGGAAGQSARQIFESLRPPAAEEPTEEELELLRKKERERRALGESPAP